jgi:hypothetical protein
MVSTIGDPDYAAGERLGASEGRYDESEGENETAHRDWPITQRQPADRAETRWRSHALLARIRSQRHAGWIGVSTP